MNRANKRQYSRRLKLEDYIKHLAWSHDDKYLAVVCGEKVKLLNFEDFSIVKQIQLQYACFVDFTACGKFILIGSWNKGYFLTMEDFLNLE